jgi:chromosome segregation ATPase
MKALSSARDTFNEEVNNVQTLLLDAEQQHQRAHDRYKQATEMKKSLDHHMAIKEKEVQDMNKERSRVQRLEMYHMKELRDIEVAKQRLEAERKAILNEARAKEQAALKMRLESAQSIAQEKGNAQTEIDNMKGYVLEQERLRIDAENHAREMHSKNTFLADRMRVLSDKLDKARREVKQLKASSSTVKIEDGAATLPRSASPKRRRAESTLPPQSLSQLDDDGFVEVGCYRATPIKRARQSVEADDGAIIVLDDDDDDDFMNYPMPGFPHFTSI